MLTHSFPNSGRHCCSTTHSSISVEDKEDHKRWYRRPFIPDTEPPDGALRTIEGALTYATLTILSHYVSCGAGAGEGAGGVSAKGVTLTGLQARNCSQRTLIYVCMKKYKDHFFFKCITFFFLSRKKMLTNPGSLLHPLGNHGDSCTSMNRAC